MAEKLQTREQMLRGLTATPDHSDDALAEEIESAFNDALTEHGAQGYGRDTPGQKHVTAVLSQVRDRVRAALKGDGL